MKQRNNETETGNIERRKLGVSKMDEVIRNQTRKDKKERHEVKVGN